MNLTKKTVIVTGGASGISRATALLISQAGGHPIIGDVNEAGGAETVAEIKQAGGNADFFRLDLTDSASIDIFSEHGRFEVGFCRLLMPRTRRAAAHRAERHGREPVAMALLIGSNN